MRQRVGIARAFVADPTILIMDEPFGSLDAQTKLVLQQELLRIWKEDQKSVVFVTHDIDEALLLGNRVLVMSGRPGRILEEFEGPNGRPRMRQSKAVPKDFFWCIGCRTERYRSCAWASAWLAIMGSGGRAVTKGAAPD